jgi:hypothetical protein
MMRPYSLVHFVTAQNMKARLELPADQPCVVILDVWAVHRSERFRKFIADKYPYIKLQYIPGGCTGKAQVLDLAINKPFKARMADEVARYMYRKVCHC